MNMMMMLVAMMYVMWYYPGNDCIDNSDWWFWLRSLGEGIVYVDASLMTYLYDDVMIMKHEVV